MKYRQTLLDTARALLTESLEPGMGLLGVFEEPFRLVSRLRWLEKDTWRARAKARATAVVVAALMIVFVLPMSAGGAVSPAPPRADLRAPDPARARDASSGKEILVREETWATTTSFGFELMSERRSTSTTWIGERRAATIEGGKTFVVDLDRGIVRVVNHRNRSYVEAARPFDIDLYLPDGTRASHPYPLTTGDVVDTGRDVEYLGKTCREYSVRLWPVEGAGRDAPRELVVWATTDVPRDLTSFHELIHDVRVFFNRDPVALRELEKIRGIQLGIENVAGPIWTRTVMASQVVELARAVPPANVFDVPSGYTKKDRFTPDDF